MKISLLVGGAVGYVLGTKAGRARYEQIVRLARQVSGSQTVQSTAGVLQAQVDALGHRAKETVASHLPGSSPSQQSVQHGVTVNGSSYQS